MSKKQEKEKKVEQPAAEETRTEVKEEPVQEPPQEEAAETPAEPSAEVKALLEEKESLEGRLLRLQADFDNFRRRSSKDSEDAIHRASANLVGSMLPVLDNFERAWAAMTEGADKEGVGLIAKQLLAVLQNAGLAEIEAEGKDFDPNLHQAVMQSDGGPENKGKVMMVLQKGYILNGKLLRASMVQVGM